MPYPATIPPTPAGWDLAFSSHGIQGFEYLGNQYAFLRQGGEFLAGDGKLHVLKSTDLGLTWSDIANIAFPNSGVNPVPNAAYTTCLDGNLCYILACDTDGTSTFPGTDPLCGPLTLYVFDLDAGAFTVGPIVPASAPVINKFWTGGGGFQVGSRAAINLVRRSAGDMMFLFPGTPENVSGSNFRWVWVVSFDGSAFGSPVQYGGQTAIAHPFAQCGVQFDQSNILHAILINSSVRKYFHVGMAGDGSFGTLQTVDATTINFTSTGSDVSDIVLFDNVAVPSIGFVGVHNDGADGLIEFYTAPSGALDPVWTLNPVVSSVPVVIGISANGNELATSVRVLQGLVAIFWTVSGTSPNWRHQDGQARIEFSHSTTADITTWAANQTLFALSDTTMGATSLLSWGGLDLGFGVILNGVEENNFGEESAFAVFAPLELSYDNLPGVVGHPYSDSLLAFGGSGVYTVYEIISGSLPPGLSLNSATGLISGTPTTPGTYDFTARVTDSLGAQATTDAFITITLANVIIQLVGWKLYPVSSCADPIEVEEAPDVDFAF